MHASCIVIRLPADELKKGHRRGNGVLRDKAIGEAKGKRRHLVTGHSLSYANRQILEDKELNIFFCTRQLSLPIILLRAGFDHVIHPLLANAICS